MIFLRKKDVLNTNKFNFSYMNNRFKKYSLLLIGILTFQLTYSQENYIPGYVIKNNADTIFGFVDYRNWEINPDRIKFKTNIENNPVSYTPMDINEFKVRDEIYVSGIVNAEVTPTQTDKLEFNPHVKIKVETIFLQTLFQGKKSLFFYKNSVGRENFYIKQDTGFVLLLYKRYLTDREGKYYPTENKTYLGQLTFYLNDCSTIKSKLENTSYNKKSLIKLFQYYYGCSQSDIVFQKEIEKVHTEIGILAGVSLTSLEFRSSTTPYLAHAEYNSSVNPSAGLFFDFVIPRYQGKWSIYNELLISSYKVKGSYEEHVNENIYSITTTEIGYSYLNINSLVRFKYPICKGFIFLNVGISNGFSINETNYKKKESISYSSNNVVEELALDDTRKYEQSYILGTGIKYNRFSMEIRYEKGNGMSEYISLNSLTKSYYLLFGYRF